MLTDWLRTACAILLLAAAPAVAQLDAAECSSLEAAAASGLPDPGAVTSYCNSYLGYTTPAVITTTKTATVRTTLTKVVSAKVTSTLHYTTTDTVTVLTTILVIVTARDNRLDSRQILGGVSPSLISQLCSCLGVTAIPTPIVTTTRTVRATSVKSSTKTSTATVRVTSTVVSTVTSIVFPYRSVDTGGAAPTSPSANPGGPILTAR